MKVWIFSDLHLEMEQTSDWFRLPDADLCICAGDVADQGIVPSINWLTYNVLPCMPVVFVAGNHEFYGSSIRESLVAAYEEAKQHDGFYLLDGDSVEFDKFRVVGATLWTDFELHGLSKLAKLDAQDQLNDYKRIKLSKRPFKRFTPTESQYLHREALIDIDNFYRSTSVKPTVVVSHHAPSLMSVPREFLNDPLTPAFASSLEMRILQYQPLLWVHGHVHSPSDYLIGKTRVVCNPLGYPGEPSRKTFNPSLVIDLDELAKK